MKYVGECKYIFFRPYFYSPIKFGTKHSTFFVVDILFLFEKKNMKKITWFKKNTQTLTKHGSLLRNCLNWMILNILVKISHQHWGTVNVTKLRIRKKKSETLLKASKIQLAYQHLSHWYAHCFFLKAFEGFKRFIYIFFCEQKP